MTNEIDFTELKQEVMNAWDTQGVNYLNEELYPDRLDSTIKLEYQEILDDPTRCIQELGFDNFSDYMISKNKEA